MKGYPERIDSKFRFVLLAAMRTEQMMRGASPKVEGEGRKLTRIALQEIRDDAVTWDYGPAVEPTAAEEEIEQAIAAEGEPAVAEEAQG